MRILHFNIFAGDLAGKRRNFQLLIGVRALECMGARGVGLRGGEGGWRDKEGKLICQRIIHLKEAFLCKVGLLCSEGLFDSGTATELRLPLRCMLWGPRADMLPLRWKRPGRCAFIACS